jgi:hypothetical protein
MGKHEKNVINQELAENIEALKKEISLLSEKYPGCDIIELLRQERHNYAADKIKRSEIEYFKNLAVSSLGTKQEIPFDDFERGLLKAALTDGRNAFQDYLEIIPEEAPITDDGTKMQNHGFEKKT